MGRGLGFNGVPSLRDADDDQLAYPLVVSDLILIKRPRSSLLRGSCVAVPHAGAGWNNSTVNLHDAPAGMYRPGAHQRAAYAILYDAGGNTYGAVGDMHSAGVDMYDAGAGLTAAPANMYGAGMKMHSAGA